jgi:hypothetical protein
MLLRVGKGVVGDLLKEHRSARADLRHFDSHARVGLAALIERDCVRTAPYLLPVTRPLDAVIDPQMPLPVGCSNTPLTGFGFLPDAISIGLDPSVSCQ